MSHLYLAILSVLYFVRIVAERCCHSQRVATFAVFLVEIAIASVYGLTFLLTLFAETTSRLS